MKETLDEKILGLTSLKKIPDTITKKLSKTLCILSVLGSTMFGCANYNVAQKSILPDLIKNETLLNNSEFLKLIDQGMYAYQINEYSSNFNYLDLVTLNNSKIDATMANQYDGFDGKSIVDFIKAAIKPSTALSYTSQFTAKQIIYLCDNDINSKTALEYSKHDFDVYETVTLKNAKIKSSLASEYKKIGIRVAEIIDCVRFNIKVKVAKERFNSRTTRSLEFGKIVFKYDGRFSLDGITELHKNGVSNSIAKEYDSRFNGKDISVLSKNKISPLVAIKYLSNFDGYGIVDLIKYNIPAKIANEYGGSFNVSDIHFFVENNVSAATVNKYDDFFKEGYSVRVLTKDGKYLNLGEVAFFVKNNISPDVANKYHGLGVGASEIFNLIKQDISSNKLKELCIADHFGYSYKSLRKYNCKRFSVSSIIRFVDAGIGPNYSNEYDSRFNEKQIFELIHNSIGPRMANGYDQRFNAKQIIRLVENEYSAEFVNKYNQRFNGSNVIKLIIDRVPPSKANSSDLHKK